MKAILRILPFLYIFSFLLGANSVAQNKTLYVKGRVTDAANGAGIINVNISVLNSATGTSSDKAGYYGFKVKANDAFTLNYTHISYKTFSKKIYAAHLQDTIELNIVLNANSTYLREINISATNIPDTVFGSKIINIQDFEFHKDLFIFLAYEKRLAKESKIVLANKDQEILSSIIIPDKAEELYKDFLGHVNIICKDAVYRVKIEDEKIVLAALPKKEFYAQIRPCVDTLKGRILFSDYRWSYPEFNYYAYNHTDSSKALIKNIIDKPLHRMYRYEYYFMPLKDKVYAMKLSAESGVDKHEIAANMTGFPYSMYYTPLYAPLFVVKDTICVFDHYDNKIYKYSDIFHPVDSVGISYHQPKDWREWESQLLKDEVNGNIYAVFLKNGYYFLKKIDTNTGELSSSNKLYFKYVEKMRIKDDYVYYTYRPFESMQKKFLFRERIN